MQVRMRREDLWKHLAGSPELRPATPSIVSSLAICERQDEIADADMEDTDCPSAPPMLDSLIHLHELPESYAFAYFERDTGTADVQTPSGHVVANERPVVPRVVLAQRVVWVPVVSSDECTGHRFQLLGANDAVQGYVECFVDSTSVRRLAFVHRNYSVAARAAGLIDNGSLVEYNSPSSHFHKLPSNEVYLPTQEVAIGTAMHPEFGAPLSIHPRHASNPTASVAAAVWTRVRQEAAAIWEVAREAAEAHNRSETARSGLG